MKTVTLQLLTEELIVMVMESRMMMKFLTVQIHLTHVVSILQVLHNLSFQQKIVTVMGFQILKKLWMVLIHWILVVSFSPLKVEPRTQAGCLLIVTEMVYRMVMNLMMGPILWTHVVSIHRVLRYLLLLIPIAMGTVFQILKKFWMEQIHLILVVSF